MSKNNLINSLSKEKQELVLAKAEIVDLTLSQIICVFDKPVISLYFPIDGFISVTQSIDKHPPLEIGMIGREGMLGAEVILGSMRSPFGALVQGSGNAWKINANDFLTQIENIPEFKSIVYSYLAVRINQLGLSASCEHFHEIGPRLAKWLLMSQDRAHSPTFQMTHEFIALMLGVRRVGITTTAADFRRRGLIEYHRGEMKVLNRSSLKAEACSCYQKNRKIYSSYIG